jgi:hypothetical protein
MGRREHRGGGGRVRGQAGKWLGVGVAGNGREVQLTRRVGAQFTEC